MGPEPTLGARDGVLDGIRVVEFAQNAAIPHCGRLLAGLGADVVKIEPPGGDAMRLIAPMAPGEGRAYVIINPGKRSLAVDLGAPQARPVVDALLAWADVALVAFKLPDLERYGIGWDHAKTVNPRLIHLTHTALGPEGPDADHGGYDGLVQGRSGLGWVMNRSGGTAPQPTRPAVNDFSTGFVSAFAVMAALRHRDRTGEGQRVDTSLLGTAMSLATPISTYFPEDAEALEMRDALLRIMSDRHPWMRNSHAYGEPGAALGLLAFASAQPAEFERLFSEWRSNYLMHWEPGYGLHFSMPHMGAPYMEGDLLVNAVYGMLWSYAGGGLHVTGGNPGQWLALPADPERELEVIAEKSGNGIVTLTCDRSSAAIYVTTDGTRPTRGSLRYRLPFAPQAGMQIRARAYDENTDTWGAERSLDCDALTTEITVMGATGFADSDIAKNRAGRAFDGKDGVSWMTNNAEGRLDYPHEVVLDLSKTVTLSALRLSLDRDSSAPNEVHAFTSVDGAAWAPDTSPEQTWALANYADEISLEWPSAIDTRYLKLRFPSSFDGAGSYMNLREIRFIGLAPTITVDAASGLVAISKPISTGELRYTTDGSVPTSTSTLYTDGFTIGADGGLVQARIFENGEAVGALAIATASGDNNRNSYTTTVSSQQGGAAENAVDGDPATIWHSQWNLVHPHHITLDLGSEKSFHGFYYKPRSGGGNGTIDEFEVYLSNDGVDFGAPVLTGSYTALGYPRNDDLRTVRFDFPVSARYMRVRSLSGQDGHPWFSVAELGIVEQPFHPREEQDALALGYTDWLQIFEYESEDSDEYAAALEYFMGTDPTATEASDPIRSWHETITGTDGAQRSHFAFRTQRDTRAQATGRGMVSTDLLSWQSLAEAEADGTIVMMTENHSAEGIQSKTYRAAESVNQVRRLFFKVEATIAE